MNLNQPTLIGVVHLPPLPGSPRYGRDMATVVASAVYDAKAYLAGGAHAVVMENFGDAPFSRERVAAETVGAMATAAASVREVLGGKIPLGFNVLRNDPLTALGLCASCGGDFLRVNVLTGAAVTDQGVIEGDAYTLMRERARLAPHVKILADIHVKHAQPLGGGDIRDAARDCWERSGADALIVSGSGTGHAVDLSELEAVRAAVPDAPILLGSGSTPEGLAAAIARGASGALVGTWAKEGGELSAPVNGDRVGELFAALGL